MTKVVGAMGRIGAGKDVMVEYLSRKLQIQQYGEGDLLRKIANSRHMPPTRENLQNLSEEYRERFGEDFLILRLVERLTAEAPEIAAVSDVRTPLDVEVLRRNFGYNFLLVNIQADPEVRFRRLRGRGEPRDPRTWEEFMHQDEEEEKRFQIGSTAALADLTLINDGSLRDFYEQVERHVIKGFLQGPKIC